MHSRDRTLLANLGFNDPDKKLARHDLACQYLTIPENAIKLADLCLNKTRYKASFENPIHVKNEYDGAAEFRGTGFLSITGVHKSITEFMISKGEGKYQSVIGFLDVLNSFSLVENIEGEQRIKNRASRQEWGDWKPHTEQSFFHGYLSVAIEVKITPCSVGDIIRQIKLYRQFLQLTKNLSAWIAATAFPLTAADVEQLSRERIKHIMLGSRFEEFVHAQNSASDIAKSPEI